MKKSTLILGDILTLLIVTLIGFAFHDESGLSFLPRILAVLVPMLVSWLLLAPWSGLLEPEITSNVKQLWRPVLAMFFAGSLAVILRGLILNAPIIPIFGVVMGATSALGILIWRGIAVLLSRHETR